jgi:hypothetical protein
MLTILVALTFTLFGALYPLFLWMTVLEKVGSGIHRFTLAMSSLLGGVGVIFLWRLELEESVRMLALIWLISLMTVTWFYWKRKSSQPWVVSIPPLLGVVVFGLVLNNLIGGSAGVFTVSILGGLIVASSVFSMVLGHWYLNVAEMPISLLRRAVQILFLFLLVRVVWDGIALLTVELETDGFVLSLFQFLQSFDGFFLFIGLFFGTLVPVVLCLLTLRTIAIHSTQSATGLLYVIVLSVLMGDLFYKYYLLQFGLSL